MICYEYKQEAWKWSVLDELGMPIRSGHTMSLDEAMEQAHAFESLPPPAPRPRSFWEDGAEPWPVDPGDQVTVLDGNGRAACRASVRSTRPGERCQLTRDGRTMVGWID